MTIIAHLTANPGLAWVFITILGLCVGSFLNAVVYRLPIIIEMQNRYICQTILTPSITTITAPKVSLTLWLPRSFCCHCRKSLTFWHNLPLISYILQKGQSHCCQQKIPQRYLWIEILSTVATLLLFLRFDFTITFAAALLLSWTLIALSFIDIATLTLPDSMTLPCLWLGLLCNTYHLFTSLDKAVLGAILGYLSFYCIAKLMQPIRKTEVLGQGDFKLLALLGAWFGWQSLPLIIFLASFTGIIISIIYLKNQQQRLTVKLPFGPFLASAGFIILFKESVLIPDWLHLLKFL